MLGSGLADAVAERIDGSQIAYGRLHAPEPGVPGHPGVAHVGVWAGKRVAAFAGRAHLYEGHSPAAVTYVVRLAATCGARTLVLTNAAGGLHPSYQRGDVMLVRDHINLTGATPLDPSLGSPFLAMADAYAPGLRTLARENAPFEPLHEGVYAGVRGPQYETPAESEALRRLGADATGMSTVLETLAARALGLDVLGISLITNGVADVQELSHDDVLAASREGGRRVAELIESVLAAL